MSLIYKKSFLFLFLTSLVLNAYLQNIKTEKIDKEKYELIELILEKLPVGPPPLGVFSKNTIRFNNYVDSINETNITITVLDHFIASEKTPNHSLKKLEKYPVFCKLNRSQITKTTGWTAKRIKNLMI